MPVLLAQIIREELETATLRIAARVAELLGIPLTELRPPSPPRQKAAARRGGASPKARKPKSGPTASRQGRRSTPAQLAALQGKLLAVLEGGEAMRAGEIMAAAKLNPKAERQRVGRALDVLIASGFVMRLEQPGAPTYRAIAGR